MVEMAELYSVSEEDFKIQLEAHKTLSDMLEKAFFTGKLFYPKHQNSVFRFLGDPIIEKPKKEEPEIKITKKKRWLW